MPNGSENNAWSGGNGSQRWTADEWEAWFNGQQGQNNGKAGGVNHVGRIPMLALTLPTTSRTSTDGVKPETEEVDENGGTRSEEFAELIASRVNANTKGRKQIRGEDHGHGTAEILDHEWSEWTCVVRNTIREEDVESGFEGRE